MFRSKNKSRACQIIAIFCRGLRIVVITVMNIIYVLRVALTHVLKWTRTRKIFVAVIFVALVLFTSLYSKLFHSSNISFGNSDARKFPSCMIDELSTYHKLVDSYGAFINHIPMLPNENFLIPYIGNGHIAIEAELDSYIHIKHGRTLGTMVPYLPMIGVNLYGFQDTRSIVLNIEHGMVHQIQCFEVDYLCIRAKSSIYAHRRRPSILVQEINISNPSSSPLEFEFDWRGFQLWPSAQVTNFRVGILNVTLGATVVKSTNVMNSYAVVVLGTGLPQNVQVKAGSTFTFLSTTVVRYEEIQSGVDKRVIFEALKSKAIEDLKQAQSISPRKLAHEHTSAWLSLWSSGFYISNSLALGVVNGHQINRTMYYVLSNIRSPLLELGTEEEQKLEAQKLLYSTDRCYGNHHTLQNMKMWAEVLSVQDIISVIKVWLITLEKHGCGKMMESGAEGVLQAMILSYGPLRFSNDHLEFSTHPSDLHRDLHFRRINYGSDTHINISVRVGDDNKASLYVSLDRNNLTYHACDAGCLDPPVRLSKEEVVLPVKLTNPLTPILYITSDLHHMEELRHAIHVHSVDEAPAHQHQVIIMHKHGSTWGGLPFFFWVVITTLIIVFHLFLFKLVYNEYCPPQDFNTNRFHSERLPQRYV